MRQSPLGQDARTHGWRSLLIGCSKYSQGKIITVINGGRDDMPIVKQGDSLWIDYDLSNYKVIDSTWANWSGTYEISTTETSTPALTGTLVRSNTEGTFNLRLNTTNSTWNAIGVGTYKLMVQFYNSTAEYREERHDVLTVRTQGL